MIVIGITGGIASGKSVASNVCKKYNAYIFDADEEAKKLLFTKEISQIVLDAFPTLDSITLESLAKVVFANKESQKKIESNHSSSCK